jgi:hypothetical protein
MPLTEPEYQQEIYNLPTLSRIFRVSYLFKEVEGNVRVC